MPPKFGSSAPKCPRCSESVYPQEAIQYDQTTYHTHCFKCLECKSALSLSRVAQIEGDLYCKNCFMRIFTREGRYSSFAAHRNSMITPPPGHPSLAASRSLPTAPKPLQPSPNSANASVSPSPSPSPMSPPPANGSVSPSPSASYPSRSMSVIVRPTPVLSPQDKLQQTLFQQIDTKNVDGVRSFIAEHGVDCLFRSGGARNQTPIEHAFSGFVSNKAAGHAMLDALKTELEKLRNAAKNTANANVSVKETVTEAKVASS